MKIYLIPGLGFDNRIFDKFLFEDIDFEYVNWIEPERNESITKYAQRISERINENLGKIILIGHSLGGILSQEISTLKNIDRIILISSIKSREELPFHFKIINPLNLHRLFTKNLVTKTIKFWGKRHEYESWEEQQLVKDMINNQSNFYLQWALKQLSIWKSPKIPSSTKIFHIHGDSDKTFPIRLITNPHEIVKNAGHFMVFKHSSTLNKMVIEELKK